MRTTVQGPDGGYITVEHPEGASDADIIAFAQANYKPTPAKIGKEGLMEAAKQVGEESSAPFAIGLGNAMQRAVAGVANLPNWISAGAIPKGYSQETLDVGQAAQKGAGPIATAGNIAGNVATALGVPGASANIPAQVGYNMATEPDNRLLAGGLTAGIGLGARVLTGTPLVKPTTEAERLANQEIIPTIGQAGEASGGIPGKIVSSLEQKLQSIPIVGDIISAARNRAREQLGKSAIELGTGQKVSSIGQEGVDEAAGKLSQAYTNLMHGKTVTPDNQLITDLIAAKSAPKLPLNAARSKEYDDIIDKLILQRLPANGQLPADLAKKEIEADLGAAYRNLSMSSTAEERALGDAVKAARDAWREMTTRTAGVNPAERAALDKGWAGLKDLENATWAARANGGNFTPLQLLTHAKEGTPLAQLGADAQKVLKSTVPNSGTTDRAILAWMLANPVKAATVMLPGAPLASLLYSSPVQAALHGSLTSKALPWLAPALTQGAEQGVLQDLIGR